MFKLVVESEFEAAHQLTDGQKPIEPLHGHTWKVEVGFEGEKLDQHGVAADFIEIRKKVDGILKTFDSRLINELPMFKNVSPSTEAVAQWLFQVMKKQWGAAASAALTYVRVWEGHGCSAAYYED